MADVQQVAPEIDQGATALKKRGSEDNHDPKDAQAQKKQAMSEPSIELRIGFGKVQQTVSRGADTSIAQLKEEIAKETSVRVEHQKHVFKGQYLKDEQILGDIKGLKSGSKIMVIGVKEQDLKIARNTANTSINIASDFDAKPTQEPWRDQGKHKIILGKPKPDDTWPGIAGKQVPLADSQTQIPGLLNSQGTKVRLTFKSDIGQLWIGSATHTQKILYSSVSRIEAQEIGGEGEGKGGYSIVRIQLGAAAANSYWLYYVPSQYVAAIKLRILGVASLLE